MMLLWIDEFLLAFRRLDVHAPTMIGGKEALFVYKVIGNYKLCRGDFDDGGFNDYWLYPSATRAVEVCFTWDGIGDAPEGWVQHKGGDRPGKRCRPDGDPAKEYVKDLPPEPKKSKKKKK